MLIHVAKVSCSSWSIHVIKSTSASATLTLTSTTTTILPLCRMIVSSILGLISCSLLLFGTELVNNISDGFPWRFTLVTLQRLSCVLAHFELRWVKVNLRVWLLHRSESLLRLIHPLSECIRLELLVAVLGIRLVLVSPAIAALWLLLVVLSFFSLLVCCFTSLLVGCGALLLSLLCRKSILLYSFSLYSDSILNG